MTITTTHPAPAAEPGGPGGPQALRSVLGKASLILTAFREEDLSLSLTELTRRTGIAKATVHRLCQGLIEAELLERDGARYRLGLRLFEIGLRAPAQRMLRQAARPIVEELAQALGNAVILAVPKGGEVLCIENAGTHRNWANSVVSGRRMRLYCSAAGKLTVAMLPAQYPLSAVVPQMERRTPRTLTPGRLPAELERVRREGYATEIEETRIGYHAVAVPVLGPDGVYLAALSVIAPTAGTHLPRLLRELASAAEAISTRLARQAAHAAPS
jgi:DNA-binding IclR family transcriptional regulator